MVRSMQTLLRWRTCDSWTSTILSCSLRTALLSVGVDGDSLEVASLRERALEVCSVVNAAASNVARVSGVWT
jgi:hypothetical protein